MKLSVVLPIYNEEKLLPEIVGELSTFLKENRFEYELLLVENGSNDRSIELSDKFANASKNIKAFHLPKSGYGLALIYGIKKAAGDFVVIFNADFWDKNFINLVKVNLLDYDIVTGSKNISGARDQRPLGRQMVTKGFSLFLNLACGYKGTDTHGIKVFRKAVVLPVVKKCILQTGIFDSELMIRAERAKLKILELPVEVIEKRPNRFGLKRILYTPLDIFQLYSALRRK